MYTLYYSIGNGEIAPDATKVKEIYQTLLFLTALQMPGGSKYCLLIVFPHFLMRNLNS